MYAVQCECPFGFLTNGRELVCCGFRASNPPGVRDCLVNSLWAWLKPQNGVASADDKRYLMTAEQRISGDCKF